MTTIRIDTFPVSTNNMYFGRRILTKMARDKKHAIGWEARQQYSGEPLEESLFVTIDFYFRDRRNHDIDNIKGLLDSFTGILWLDDGQITKLHLSKHIDGTDPRIEIKIARA